MQTYDIQLAVNGVRQIHVNANFIYFLEGSAGGADATIAIQPQTGSETILLKPGQSFRLPPEQANQNWTISNHKKEATIAGRILMGLGDFADNRISGSVEVVDGGKFRTMANAAFGIVIYSGQVAAQYSATQFKNPAGSGKRAIIKSMTATSINAGNYIGIFPGAADLLNTSIYPVINKQISQAFSSPMVGKWETTVSGNPNSALAFLAVIAANSRDTIVLQEPIVLLPGASLVMQAGNPNLGFTSVYEWTEESI